MRRLVLSVSLCLLSVCLFGQTPLAATEQAWEIRGEVVSLKAGDPSTVEFRISGGGLVELPLAAFTEKAQLAIREMSPGGRPVVKGAADSPSALAEDLAACRLAADAADLCRLALADGDLTGEARASVEAMLHEFDGRATRGESRLGGKWVGPEVAAQAAAKAAGHVAKAMEMIRLGNLKLAEQELRQASQADPASGRADFLMGLAFMMGVKPDLEEAVKAFEEVVRREPENGAAWNNLAICNVQRRRYPNAVTAFRSAAITLADPQPVVGNLALMIRLAADRRSRISSNQLDEITALYHGLVQAGGIAAPDGVSGPVVLSPDGNQLAATGIGDLRSLLPPEGDRAGPGEFTGVVVAPGIIVCSLPSASSAASGGITVLAPDGRNLSAQIVAREPTGSVVLLKCDDLDVVPLPLAATSAAAKEQLVLVSSAGASGRPGGSVADPVRATMLGAAAGVGRPRFVYEPERDSGQLSPRSEPGSVMLDPTGNVTGFGLRQPTPRRSAGARRLGLPVESVWKLLGEIDPSIAPAAPDGPAGKLSAEEAVARSRSAMVQVRAENPSGSAP